MCGMNRCHELHTNQHGGAALARRALAFCPRHPGLCGPSRAHTQLGHFASIRCWFLTMLLGGKCPREGALGSCGLCGVLGPLCQALRWALRTQRCQTPSWGASQLRPEAGKM